MEILFAWSFIFRLRFLTITPDTTSTTYKNQMEKIIFILLCAMTVWFMVYSFPILKSLSEANPISDSN